MESVGWVMRAMIVTSELVRDLGTAKFIPIIRQNTDHPEVPTSVSTRRYVNLSDGVDRGADMETLLRDLHSIPPEKPRLEGSPFADTAVEPAREHVEASSSSESTVALESPAEFYRSALSIAERGDMLRWRRTVAQARRLLKPALDKWSKKYATIHPGDIETLIEQSMEGAPSFAPLTAVALAGVASGQPRFSNQIGLTIGTTFTRKKSFRTRPH
jgi:hypothetical protein